MNRKISIGGALALALMLSAVTFIITMTYAEGEFDDKVFNLKERQTMYSKLAEVDSLVRKNYYNVIDEEKLNDSLIQGYVEGIGDTYGLYLTAEQYSQTISGYEGQLVDIGITCEPDTGGYILVQSVQEESPAALAGIEAGDLIVKVDELSVTSENYTSAVEALKGEAGTTVALTVRRSGVERVYNITRRRMELRSIEYHAIDDVGYIRITEFNDNTPSQFNRALSALEGEGVRGLIFDVRGNPGGTIESVAEILDTLLPEGPIVSSTDRDGVTTLLYSSDEECVDLPMAVLINQNSASAAELFAQALKDYNKARTVGVTTYGKGSMQKIYPLSDGSALDITVALYNPPTSPNFEGVGVKPDYEVHMSAELEKMIGQLDEESDVQLQKALEVVEAAIRNSNTEPDVPPSVYVPASSDESSSSEDEDSNEDSGDESSDSESSDDESSESSASEEEDSQSSESDSSES